MEAYSQESWEKASDAHIARTIEKLRGKKQTNMAKVADMEMEIRHVASPMELSVEIKIKLIDSALELIRELKLEPEKSSDEEDAYNAALGFLAIQYNDQCRVEIALPKEPPGKSVEPVVHMRAH